LVERELDEGVADAESGLGDGLLRLFFVEEGVVVVRGGGERFRGGAEGVGGEGGFEKLLPVREKRC
jgi:hypothetical protein